VWEIYAEEDAAPEGMRLASPLAVKCEEDYGNKRLK